MHSDDLSSPCDSSQRHISLCYAHRMIALIRRRDRKVQEFSVTSRLNSKSDHSHMPVNRQMIRTWRSVGVCGSP